MPLRKLTRAKDRQAAQRQIREQWRAGRVIETPHEIEGGMGRMIDDIDIRNVILRGVAVEGGASGHEETPHRYVLEGHALDGAPLRVVVDVNGFLKIVTVYAEG